MQFKKFDLNYDTFLKKIVIIIAKFYILSKLIVSWPTNAVTLILTYRLIYQKGIVDK